MQTKKNPILLLDGNYLMHRTLHVQNYMAMQYKGTFTGGVYGFLKSVSTVANKFDTPSKIIVVWDGRKSERRKSILQKYKDRGTRSEEIVTPEEVETGMSYGQAFEHQKKLLWTLFPFLGIVSYLDMKFEADDVIANIVYNFRELSQSLVIVSDDRDFLQLYTPQVSIYRPIADEFLDRFHFKILTGYETGYEYLVHKCMLGDPSDLIGGIPGVGPKTARKILQAIELKDDPTLDAEAIATYAQSQGKSLHKNVNQVHEKQGLTGIQLFVRNLALIDFRYEAFTPLDLKNIRDVAFGAQNHLGTPNDVCDILSEFGFHSMIKNYSWQIEQPFHRLNYG